MLLSRFLFFSSKHGSRQPLNLLQRFSQCKNIQSRSYAKSTGPNRAKQDRCIVPLVHEEETQASRSWGARTWGALVIPVAVFSGLATFVYLNDQRRAIPKGESNKFDCVDVKGPIIGGPFTLIDTDNRVVTEKNFLGNWVLLYFGYTSSPDVGPEQVQVMAKAIDMLESKDNLKVLPVFVSIDPQRDTPSHLRAYLKEFDSRIVGLTGPVVAVRQMAQEYRVYFRKVEEEGDDYLVESSHNMYLINPNMEIAKCFGIEYNAEQLSEAIRKELKRHSP
ncbi:protein SCO1 homolog 2, mitochondrial isoform X1 [Jatropha curcas]|uniref:protein SCO1 homolog 2, mitochondrial isoform X1 n=1 Tax=Jatropha curcas TaxID=180498 RepID=UPI00189561BB|nr:protein SCO1 homolog 2, mitochondrial isoform X1 [Jatropha curcas]